tara:strand:+ start:84 stop:422 length:339 start_codon:yes stop_codon:yes gene_type:complete
MNKIEIVEVEGYWVVAGKSRYDEENERSILGVGATKEEALEKSLLHTIEIQQSFQNAIEEAAKLFRTEQDMEGLGQYLEVPGVSMEANGEINTRVGALWFDDEENKWCWFFR